MIPLTPTLSHGAHGEREHHRQTLEVRGVSNLTQRGLRPTLSLGERARVRAEFPRPNATGAGVRAEFPGPEKTVGSGEGLGVRASDEVSKAIYNSEYEI